MKYTVSHIRGRTCIKFLRTGAEEYINGNMKQVKASTDKLKWLETGT